MEFFFWSFYLDPFALSVEVCAEKGEKLHPG